MVRRQCGGKAEGKQNTAEGTAASQTLVCTDKLKQRK